MLTRRQSLLPKVSLLTGWIVWFAVLMLSFISRNIFLYMRIALIIAPSVVSSIAVAVLATDSKAPTAAAPAESKQDTVSSARQSTLPLPRQLATA